MENNMCKRIENARDLVDAMNLTSSELEVYEVWWRGQRDFDWDLDAVSL